jgi:hypothetical protein
MKYLGVAKGSDEAGRIQDLLESRGIPVRIEKESMFRGVHGAGLVYASRIYVCLPSQYPDAVALLTDPNHQVANPVDVSHYWKWVDAQPLAKQIVWGAPLLLLLVLAGLTLVLWLTGVVGGT